MYCKEHSILPVVFLPRECDLSLVMRKQFKNVKNCTLRIDQGHKRGKDHRTLPVWKRTKRYDNSMQWVFLDGILHQNGRTLLGQLPNLIEFVDWIVASYQLISWFGGLHDAYAAEHPWLWEICTKVFRIIRALCFQYAFR